MTSRSMAFRFPIELAQAIEARAKATGRDKTAVVVEALTQVFGLPLPSPASVTVETLREQLNQLEVKIASGSKQLAELHKATSTDTTLHLVADLVQMIAAQPGSTNTASVQATPPISKTDAPARQTASGTSELQPVTEGPQREEMLEKILSATSDLMFACDRSGQLTYINSVGTQVLGMNGSQLLGRTCQELGLISDVATRQMQYETVFETGQPVNGNSIFTVSEGTRSYEYILSPIHGTNGNIEAVLCTAKDITEREQAEVALRESEANYRHLFDSANDSILVLDAATRRILNANWNAARRLGYTRSELLQLSGADIFVPMDNNLAEDIFRELLVTGNLIFKYFQRCKDGTLIPVESSSQTIEYEGRLAIQSCVRDISDRQKAELALRRSEARYRLLAEESTDVISLHNPEGVYLYASSACRSLLGYAPEELVGASAYEFIHSQDVAAVRSCHAVVLSSHVTHTMSYRVRHKDSSSVWFESTCRAVLNSETSTREIIAVSRITARRSEDNCACHADP